MATRAKAETEPITDLPFNGVEDSSCGWHWDCSDGRNATEVAGGRGVDFSMDLGELARAGGNGTIQFGGWSQRAASYGNEVIIDHDSVTSHYCHLDQWFWTDPGVEVCAGVPVGYVGSTGGNWADHLHFESNTIRFTPIMGNTEHSEADFDFPSATLAAPQTFSHDAITSTYRLVDNGAPDEFAANWTWQTQAGGFGEAGETPDFLSSPTGGLPNGAFGNYNYAEWFPILPAAGHKWFIYAFVPDEHATTPNALYRISVWSPQYGLLSEVEVRLDQSTHENEFVLLNPNSTHITVPTGYELLVELYTWDWESQCSNGCPTNTGPCGTCPQAEVAADAMLFIDSICVP